MTVVGDNWKLLLISFVVANGAMYQYGYLSVYINPAQASFTNYINSSYFKKHNHFLTQDNLTWIWSVIVNCYQFGFLLGTIVAPWIVERVGRKRILVISGLFDVIGTFSSVIAIPTQMYSLLALGRLIIGFGSGLSCCGITLYLQEISPTNVRGLVSSFQEMSVSFITIFGMVMGLPSVLGSTECLQYLIGLSLLPAISKLILLWCPETPKYLYLRKGNLTETRNSVLFYHSKNVDVDSVVDEIIKEGELEKENDLDFITQEMNTPSRKPPWKIMQIVKVAHLRRAVLIGSITFAIQETTGVIPLVEFSTDILEDIRLPSQIALLAALLIGVGNAVTTFTSLFIVEKYGRKKLLLSGLSGVILLLISLMICYLVAPIVSSNVPGYAAAVIVVTHVCVFGLGPGTVPWFITSELVPQSVRSTAQSIAQVFNILSNLIVSFVFMPAFNAWGPYSFLIFIVPTTMGTIYLYFELPETKNQEISEIVMNLKIKLHDDSQKTKF